MLELIFQGFLEWTYGLILEAWEYFSSVLLDLMSLDFAYLRTHMPIIDTIMEIMLAVGWALLLGNLVFQAVKGMVTGLGFEAEDPKLLFTRTFVFAFLLLASPQICRIGLDMTSTVIELLEMPDAVDVTFADEASFGGLTASWLLVILCGTIVMFQTFKLIMEMAERYFILAVLTITAPLAFGMGGSRNTSDIFTGWCRMFGSMCLLMAMNVVFMKMLLSVLSFYPSGLDVLPWMVLVVTVVKVAKKADGILARIGLNPAMTGDTLGRGLPGMLAYTVLRTMTSNVARTMGKGSRGDTPASGSGKPNNRRSSGPSGTRAGASANNHRTQNQNTASQQTSVRNGAPQENSTQQTQDAAQHTNAQNSTSTSSAAQTVQANFQTRTSRNTSVPQGTRRAPSHVPQGNGTQSTAAQQSANPAHIQHNQVTNASGTVAAAAAAGTVIHGAGASPDKTKTDAKQRRAPHTSSPVQRGTSVSAATASKLHHTNTQTSSKESAQQEARSSGQLPSSQTQAGRIMAQNLPADRSANSSTHNQRVLGTQPKAASAQQHPTSGKQPKIQSAPKPGVKGSSHPSIGGRYTQQEAQISRSTEHTQSSSGTQTSSQQSQSEMRSTNRERAGSLIGTTPVATQYGEKPSAVGSTPKSGASETKPVSIGGRYTQQERQTTHSAEHNQSSSGVQTRTAQSQSDMRSTNRERTGSLGGTNPAAIQSGERPSAGGSMPKSSTAETRPASIGGRYTQQEGQSFRSAEHSQTNIGTQKSSASQQSHSVTHQAELRSTNREQTNSSPVGAVQAGAKPAVQSQPQRSASNEPRSMQRPQTEQRSTQRNAPAAQQEVGTIPRAAVAVPPTASPPHSVQSEQRSTQRNASATQQEMGTVQRAATTVPTTASPSHSAQPEQRSTQRNVSAAQQEMGTVPRSTTAVPPTASPSHSAQSEQRSSRAAQDLSANTASRSDHRATPRSVQAAVTAPSNRQPTQQEGRTSTQAKRSVPAPQESHRPVSGIGRAGMPTSAQQEQAQVPKKTFVPLAGRQPESIPSHLDLKQEPQKSTKRPDAAEGGTHVTE